MGEYGIEELAPKQNIGDTGGNTIREDSTRQTTGKQDEKAGGRLRKGLKEYFDATLQESRIEKSENLLKKAMEDMQVIVNVPEQPAPQVTVNVPETVINIPPAQVNVTVPEQKPAVVNVNMPKIKKSSQKVVRNSKDEIASTETNYEYEK